MSEVIIVGFGSIGERHYRLLKDRGLSVGVVSQREVDVRRHFVSLEAAFEEQIPDHVVIANRTADHLPTLKKLADLPFSGRALVEKPLAHSASQIPSSMPYDVRVAYNLRFHPLLQELQQRLQHERIVSVDAYVGQYLPDWRPGRDYRQTYSAHKSQGGGVLRDLSHELDYLIWLLEGWSRVVALGGKFSSLDIDSDDVCTLLMETPRCPATALQLNYLDRSGHRTVRVNTTDHTFELDLIKASLSIDGDQVSQEGPERDVTYRREHQAFLDNDDVLCTFEEGRNVMRLIEAIEESVSHCTWVKNKYSNER